MKKLIYLIITILMISIPICGLNHMEVIQTMTGEFNGSEFGFNMASIDFNCDGYDDLVVSSSCWNPDGVYNEQQMFGKLYFYWGGPSFDNIPDLVIPGTHYLNYCGHSLFNAGDINGDGHDDLIIANEDSLQRSSIEIFYSRSIPSTIPDAVLTYTTPQNVFAFPLGDINGDSHADLGLFFSGETTREHRRLKILTDIFAQPISFRDSNNTMGFPLISGVGDVNHDGIDDFYMHYPIDGINSGLDNRLVLYYGSPTFPVMDSLVISENTQESVFLWGNPVGDVNGDGTDDFIAYLNNLWLGNANLTPNWNLVMNAQSGTYEHSEQYTFQHGDFNHDGYEDIVSGSIYYGGYSGIINIWLGGQPMNNSVDLYLTNPATTEHCNFSWAKAVGDFNHDGFDDLAVSAPWWMDHDGYLKPGKVYIFSGNGSLTPNTDEVVPEVTDNLWSIEIYPNPVKHKQVLLNIRFTGTGYKAANHLYFEIYNIKGQKLLSKAISKADLKAGKSAIKLSHLAQGNYLLSIIDDKDTKTTIKFSIK